MTELINPYLEHGRIRAALRTLELRPSRNLGQNFLTDGKALAQIVAAAELDAADTVVEIGPGLGVLTWELVQRAGRVVAIELDLRLAARLREEFAHASNLELVQGDVLRQDLAALARSASYKVVANLPYQITSAALRYMLAASIRPQRIVVLVQWEVATRICAQPGDFSVLAHSIQLYAAPEIIARIPARSFEPAPAVDSAILRLQVHPEPLDPNPEALLRVIKAGFLQARKQLGNALPAGLASMGQRTERDVVLAALHAAGVDPVRRAETVTLAEWRKVAASLP